MSKFRIQVRDSHYRRYLNGVILLLMVASVWSWKSDIFVYQQWIQSLFTLCLGLYFWPKLCQKDQEQIFQVDEDGRVIWLQPQSDISWQISSRSRFNGWWHWLVLESPMTSPRQHRMLFKDSVSDADWRHLCRIVNQIIRK
ncbi:protein YgfX [Planctobacterium marinum]|uniref:protein YgfX n=1 Tax=Planctobacterium marinum TaxID=1631968 RepID=UPI001E4546C9|nr:protein YgfX [Planctobacterium marinum]MCC2604761.1 hypothetical protein [Planctobacterium marinum]